MNVVIRDKRRIAVRFAAGAVALWLALVFVFAGVLAPAHTVQAQGDPARVAVNSDLTVESSEVVTGDVSVTKGDLAVLGQVNGNAVVVGGSADIEGTITGNLVVTDGNIRLGEKSVVGGNVLIVMGGKLDRATGSVVKGRVDVPDIVASSTDSATVPTRPSEGSTGRSVDAHSVLGMLADPVSRFASLLAWGIMGLVVLVLAAAMGAVIPERVRVAGATLTAEPGPSIVVGVIAAFLLGPVMGIVMFILAVSIIGVVLVPVIAIGMVLAVLFGVVVVGLWLGRRMYDSARPGANHTFPNRVGIQASPLVVEILLGVAVLLGSTFVPSALLPGPLTVLLMVLFYFVACVGLGATILSRFGTLAPPKRAPRVPGYQYQPGYPGSMQAPPPQPQEPAITAPLGPAPVLPRED